jgi:hypothetical protein
MKIINQFWKKHEKINKSSTFFEKSWTIFEICEPKNQNSWIFLKNFEKN